ncbi:MAG: FecR family protein [Rhodospirillales bacterium]|nr:FecR family protein [Rhodospirillales bacterium]
MQRFIISVFFIFITFLSPAFGETIAGTVSKVTGEVSSVSTSGTRTLGVNDPVFIQDNLVTKVGALVELSMKDGATLTLGAESSIVIEDYTFEDDQGNASLNLTRGAFRMISGALKGVEGREFSLRTPVATIGIRGTDFWGGRLDGDYNFALLNGKGIYVENAAGRVEISQVGFGTTVKSPNQTPSPPKKWSSEKVKRALDTVRPPTEASNTPPTPTNSDY